MAVQFDGGVVLGADSRTSTGSYVANRVSDKIVPIHDYVWSCRSGSAADTQAVVDYVKHYVDAHRYAARESFRFISKFLLPFLFVHLTSDVLGAKLACSTSLLDGANPPL